MALFPTLPARPQGIPVSVPSRALVLVMSGACRGPKRIRVLVSTAPGAGREDQRDDAELPALGEAAFVRSRRQCAGIVQQGGEALDPTAVSMWSRA